jgi:hypothetical protein
MQRAFFLPDQHRQGGSTLFGGGGDEAVARLLQPSGSRTAANRTIRNASIAAAHPAGKWLKAEDACESAARAAVGRYGAANRNCCRLRSARLRYATSDLAPGKLDSGIAPSIRANNPSLSHFDSGIPAQPCESSRCEAENRKDGGIVREANLCVKDKTYY